MRDFMFRIPDCSLYNKKGSLRFVRLPEASQDAEAHALRYAAAGQRGICVPALFSGQVLPGEYFFSLKVGRPGSGCVNLIDRAGQHVPVDEEEVGVFAFADAASLLFNEHLPCTVDGQGREGLLAGQSLFRPPGLPFHDRVYACDRNLHNAERVVRTTAQRRIIRVGRHVDAVIEKRFHGICLILHARRNNLHLQAEGFVEDRLLIGAIDVQDLLVVPRALAERIRILERNLRSHRLI